MSDFRLQNVEGQSAERCVTMRLRAKPFPLPHSPFPHGITLIEILISMFVLLFGLMGVASIIPVGNSFMTDGEKYDLGSALTANAFEELQVRGILSPENWLYATNQFDTVTTTLDRRFIQPPAALAPGFFNLQYATGQGHGFIIDSIGASSEIEVLFPFSATSLVTSNPWNAVLTGTTWPVRRLNLDVDPSPTNFIPYTTPVAETIFRLRDDLAVSLPEQADRPGVQQLSLGNSGGTTIPLARQYNGNYSWLATVVPTSNAALTAMQPADENYGVYPYEVSVVVFRKRDFVPSFESERLIEAEILADGELAIYSTGTHPTLSATEEVDAALDGIRPNNWICLMGVNQTNGSFLMKWYRLLSLDEETGDVILSGTTEQGRYATIIGPDWPNTFSTGGVSSRQNLRAAILPGTIQVTTRIMNLEK